jgi:hypothetical protein
MHVFALGLSLLAGWAAAYPGLSCLENEYIHVCVDLTLGGAITFLAETNSTANVINCDGAPVFCATPETPRTKCETLLIMLLRVTQIRRVVSNRRFILVRS